MPVFVIITSIISVGSLLLWYVPVLLGYHSFFDALFLAAWLLLVSLLVVLWIFKQNSLKRLQHTTYLDFAEKTGYSQMSGTFNFIDCDSLMEKLIEKFSHKLPAVATKEKPPERFNPTAVIKTKRFVYSRAYDPTFPLIEEWKGDVRIIQHGNEHEARTFNSEMQLESILRELCSSSCSDS